MAKGKFISDEERALVAQVYLEDTGKRAKEIAARVNERLGRTLSLSTIQKILATIRKPGASSPMDLPWSIFSTPDVVSAEALPFVLVAWEQWLKQYLTYPTVREVAWIAKLCRVVKDPKDLCQTARDFAIRERALQATDSIGLIESVVASSYTWGLRNLSMGIPFYGSAESKKGGDNE